MAVFIRDQARTQALMLERVQLLATTKHYSALKNNNSASDEQSEPSTVDDMGDSTIACLN